MDKGGFWQSWVGEDEFVRKAKWWGKQSSEPDLRNGSEFLTLDELSQVKETC